jgi:hypothetical protein
MRRILWICLVIVFLAGCARQPDLGDGMTLTSKARSRLGWCPSPVVGYATNSNPDDIGTHRYGFSLWEKNGIVYTARAGHVDIAHVRKAADWTAYLSELTFAQLQEGQTTFSFRQREPSRYFVTLQYPEYWGDLTDEARESMARDVAIELGQYLAFLGGTWHEIVTWFGHNNSGLISEFSSAFSWEDTFSNLVGTHVARVALHDDEHTYNDAVTLALDRELDELGVKSKQTALMMTRSVREKWYSGNVILFTRIKKRNLDIGLDDGFVTPSLIGSASEVPGVEPKAFPVPNLDLLQNLGFSIKLEIEPREKIKNRILRVAYSDPARRRLRIEPAIHLPFIMAHIHREALWRYNFDVDTPWAAEPKEPVYFSLAFIKKQDGG